MTTTKKKAPRKPGRKAPAPSYTVLRNGERVAVARYCYGHREA